MLIVKTQNAKNKMKTQKGNRGNKQASASYYSQQKLKIACQLLKPPNFTSQKTWLVPTSNLGCQLHFEAASPKMRLVTHQDLRLPTSNLGAHLKSWWIGTLGELRSS